ncbi:MAG: GTPase HflX [Candidatus Cloacimonetes bacterium]|nr:GTPase HflX [Candidatus Cloacimonadota bacterium]
MSENIKEKAILLSACLQKDSYEQKLKSLDELERLADTAGIEVVGKFIQNRKGLNRTFYLGKGFLKEIVENNEDFDLLIFDNELLPSQGRNISKEFKVETIDRTEVILDIFHKHAQTYEAKLQIKLAELKYQLPRLKKLWSHLDRERGSSNSAGGGASRGMGEKQIEVDKRKIRFEIYKIGNLINKIVKQKDTQSKQREKIKRICLIGYTNAGKSTLFNYLTDADVLVEDKLFATLDSTVRSFNFEKGKEVVLSDTVGFIANLPHNLVASFQATLTEVKEADLLLQVVDISDDSYEKQIKDVNIVLKEIKAENITQLIVFNKIDQAELNIEIIDKLKTFYPRSVFISAKSGVGIDKMIEDMDEIVNISKHYRFFIPHSDQKAVNFFYKIGNVISKEFDENGIKLHVEMNKEDLYGYEKYIVE